jgi:hypothetical protein
LRRLYVAFLARLIFVAQKNDHLIPAPRKIKPLSQAVIDSELMHARPDRPMLVKISQRYPRDPIVNLEAGKFDAQTIDPVSKYQGSLNLKETVARPRHSVKIFRVSCFRGWLLHLPSFATSAMLASKQTA